MSVGLLGVEPLSLVHPEKVLVARSMLLCHRLVPSDPLTATQRMFSMIVTAGYMLALARTGSNSPEVL